MNRAEAVAAIVTLLTDELVVHANGGISRESFAVKDRPENFYILGAMGLPLSVGMGMALSAPSRKVIVLDGDGNLLMGIGTMGMVGATQPANLYHIVLDNEVYESTGSQQTISSSLDFAAIARSHRYRHSRRVTTPDELMETLPPFLATPGPGFLCIKAKDPVTVQAKRIPYSPEEIKERFFSAFASPGTLSPSDSSRSSFSI